MLACRHSFLFPHFEHVGTFPIVSNIYEDNRPVRVGDSEPKIIGQKVKEIPGYTLNWKAVDTIKRQEHEKWVQNYWKGKNIPFIRTLPVEYDEIIYGLKFAIPDTYMSEIRRNARRSLDEWNVKRSFDTDIREACLEPAIKHVWVAFYLTADCVYDEKTKYYSRSRMPIANIMAFKFWMYQTGGGLVWNHSDGDRIDRIEAGTDYESEYAKECRKWYSAARKHFLEWSESRKEMSADWSEAKGPALT